MRVDLTELSSVYQSLDTLNVDTINSSYKGTVNTPVNIVQSWQFAEKEIWKGLYFILALVRE